MVKTLTLDLGIQANAYPHSATYGAHSSASSLFYHDTLDCFGCVLFHLSKYWAASLSPRSRAHVFQRRPAQASAPLDLLPLRLGPITVTSPPLLSQSQSPGVCVFDSYPERPAAIDGQFSHQVNVRVSFLFPTRGPSEMPKN